MVVRNRSEIDDINLGLQHYFEEFNVINARLISAGVSTRTSPVLSARVLMGAQVRDYAGLIDQSSQALRSNGLAIFAEFDFYVTGGDEKPIVFDVLEFAPPYFPRWMCMVREAVKERGGDADAAFHLRRWISDHPAFTDAVYRSFLFPASPWIPKDHPNAAKMNRAGSLMRDDVQVRPFPLYA